jgi:hypothetical protein
MEEKSFADRMYLKTARSLAVLNGNAHPQLAAQMPQHLLDAGQDQADVVLLFALNQKELEQLLPQAVERLADKGSLWIAFLKPVAARATDLDRDKISQLAAQHGVTVVAMTSVDLDWSALRLRRL